MSKVAVLDPLVAQQVAAGMRGLAEYYERVRRATGGDEHAPRSRDAVPCGVGGDGDANQDGSGRPHGVYTAAPPAGEDALSEAGSTRAKEGRRENKKRNPGG